ncbi:hypothetical protein Tco_0778165 [Tanacetum coccineum]
MNEKDASYKRKKKVIESVIEEVQEEEGAKKRNDFFGITQQNWKLIIELPSSTGVHTIMTSTGLVIHMFVENRYPLAKEVLSNMLELKLETEEESSMALELIKFVKQQLEEFEDSNDDDTVTSTHEVCIKGNLDDKILVPEPDSSPRCAKCKTPVDGPYCRGCALLRKKFKEDLITYCVENGIFQECQDTFESSDNNTNVVNAPREPFVVNQDPGVKSSQDPPQIDHNCCYECGDSLDGIFCRQCICKSCGKGAHYGYNCPPKDPINSKSEPCNQTINEIPQTLPSLDPSYYSLPHVLKPNFVGDSPNFSYPPPQPQFET